MTLSFHSQKLYLHSRSMWKYQTNESPKKTQLQSSSDILDPFSCWQPPTKIRELDIIAERHAFKCDYSNYCNPSKKTQKLVGEIKVPSDLLLHGSFCWYSFVPVQKYMNWDEYSMFHLIFLSRTSRHCYNYYCSH